MPSWEPFSLALVRGGVRALPLTPGVQADALRSLEETAGFADARALEALRERGGGVEPGATPNPTELSELERLATRAGEGLPASERDALKAQAKALAVEEEPVARGQQARELSARLVRALVADSTLAERLARSGRPKSEAFAQGALVASRYRLVERLGKGGSGTVWRAQDLELKEDVALKVLNAEVAQDEDARERFLKEVKSARAFAHKYSVQLHEFGRDTERNAIFFTMGLVAGPTLRKVLEEKKTLPPERVARIGSQVLEALAEAHEAGIVHRDLKPENLILTKNARGEEEVRVVDFGIAKAISQAKQNTTGRTLTGTTVGTLAYMSPEQAQGKKLDGRSDLYSLAAVLYESLAGKKPIEPDKDAEDENQSLLFKLAMTAPDDVAELAPATPAPLASAIMRGLAKKPEERFADARAMHDALVAPSTPLHGTVTGLPTGGVAVGAVRNETKTGLPTGGVAVAANASVTGLPTGPVAKPAPVTAAPRPPEPKPTLAAPPSRRRGVHWALLLVLVAAAVAGAIPDVRAAVLARLGLVTAEQPALSFLELEPADGKLVLLKEAALEVRGKLSDPKAGPVRIGEPGSASPLEKPLAADGSFKARVGLNSGAKAVEVHAGSGTRAIVARIPVELDLAAPRVAIDPPAPWTGGPVEVSAHLVAAHPKVLRESLVVDGVASDPIERSAEGAESHVRLDVSARAPKSLAVRVELEDALGRKADATAEVPIDRTPPVVTITSPEAGLETNEDRVAVAAEVRSRAALGAVVVVLDPGPNESTSEAIVGQERVRWAVALPEGAHVLEVRATDALGARGVARVSVKRVPAGPKLPEGLRLAGRDVPAAGGKKVPLYLYRLPDGTDMEMVSVPAGDFVMGAEDSDAYDNEKPRHTHPMDHAYWIGRNDVTWEQYLAYCQATSGAEKPSRPDWAKDDHPVVNVSWEDAQGYCKWARGQLPKEAFGLPQEAEWEKAARGEDGRKYPWGSNWEPTLLNFADKNAPAKYTFSNGTTVDLSWRDETADDGYAYTSPVGSFPRGASSYGALDMAGNVWQWCEDKYEEKAYARYKAGDLSPPGGSYRVSRGGSWLNPARFCRASVRDGYAPGYRYDDLGFRVVLRSSP